MNPNYNVVPSYLKVNTVKKIKLTNAGEHVKERTAYALSMWIEMNRAIIENSMEVSQQT
jgi:hypothetical protein